ncbi:anaerobic ribonucleoside-triphosphate reductase activating protein [Pseudomonas paraeruginosa]|uniref:anaerobic ribonucleoside-triphosphate reductase activating protein n=1 Tax=Pseudomonas aeruginosa group TaxID=136841 RepID=UPI00053D0B91|nr:MULTISPECIES: anaerobic ribonucleoside-triphosphate reductase activating protein [Pseudomonas aeruginosa group]VTS66684.1 pyruvate formate-lyase activating enzyme [Streptococcus dysgalactiae subsp. equisimilis]KAB0742889.1 anaerobic ribonucleoside-triphosphate reductase activating protein [Pseudomonas aeruginosa]KRU82637.1 anaerobic ribonucleoside-triphosphate reductase activating protein [Pseudomonas aeruginosa]KSF79879.1 anaerobic ribonucleoside-triphosphate reductase activating protein [P
MSATLRVGGVVPLTTLDYPGLLACVLFCQGCAWRCRYCHNPELIASRGAREIPWAGLLDFLRRRQGLLQAVVFSGGEATLQAALGDAMRTVRELGFRVGLHSAGINPRAFARVLAHTDWVGFDVKALAEDVAAITGVRGSGAANWRSLERLLDSGVAYECRTTVHWRLFDSERLWHLATRLRGMGVERFAVQLARPARQLDPALLAAPAPQGTPQLWRELEALFPAFELRDA